MKPARSSIDGTTQRANRQQSDRMRIKKLHWEVNEWQKLNSVFFMPRGSYRKAILSLVRPTENTFSATFL
jgi:hypothetical protein